MGDIKRVRVGDPVTAKSWNEVVDKLRPFTNIEVAQGSYLNYSTGPSGTCLSLAIPKEIPARLIGSSSPYSWTAITETAGGTYADRVAGLMGGTSNAYEINSKAGLGGKPVMLEWTSAGDWRFQWVGYGPACGWRFVTTGCAGDPMPGCLVELRQSGVLIDSCTTASGGTVAKVKRVSGGSGYTNGSYTNGTFTGGGGSGGTFSYTVSGGVIQPTLTITNAGSGYTSAPTPVFSAGAGTGASATALLTAMCRLTPPTGTYDVTISGPTGLGFANNVASRTFSCPSSADQSVSVSLTADSSHACVPCCNYPISKTLQTTDGMGTHTLTWVDSFTQWQVTESFSQTVYTLDPEGSGACVEAGDSSTVRYGFFCNSFGAWELTISLSAVCCISGERLYAPGLGASGVSAQASGGTCFPMSLEFNLPTESCGCSDPPTCLSLVGGGGGFMVVTE